MFWHDEIRASRLFGGMFFANVTIPQVKHSYRDGSRQARRRSVRRRSVNCAVTLTKYSAFCTCVARLSLGIALRQMQTKHLHTPHCTPRDRVFHIIFVLMFCVMVGCAALAILYLQKDPNGRFVESQCYVLQSIAPHVRINSSLNADDIMVIVCSVLFFCSFFIAVFTQVLVIT